MGLQSKNHLLKINFYCDTDTIELTLFEYLSNFYNNEFCVKASRVRLITTLFEWIDIFWIHLQHTNVYSGEFKCRILVLLALLFDFISFLFHFISCSIDTNKRVNKTYLFCSFQILKFMKTILQKRFFKQNKLNQIK